MAVGLLVQVPDLQRAFPAAPNRWMHVVGYGLSFKKAVSAPYPNSPHTDGLLQRGL
jgi:hypothetical protein